MKKVTDFLEKNVEWVALGLGGLFVLFMIWTYVLNPVAKVELNGDNLGAGQVDPYTLEHVGRDLERSMAAGGGELVAAVPSYTDKFKADMAWAAQQPVTLAGVFPALPPLPDDLTSQSPRGPTDPQGPVRDEKFPDQAKVTKLPAIPKATPETAKFGRSLALTPGPNGEPPPQPGQAGAEGVDKDWITQPFKLKLGDIDAAFVAAKIPTQPPEVRNVLYKTLFLQVELQREELDADGQPVPNTQTIIAPLTTWRSNTAPPAFPETGAGRDVQGQYLQWAAANTPDIIQPLFFNTTKGDIWTPPGAPAAVATGQFSPEQYLTGPIPNWVTPEQKDLILKARQAEAKRRADEKRSTGPRSPRPRPGPGGAPPMDGMMPPGLAPRGNYDSSPSLAPRPAQPRAGQAPPNPFGPPGGIGDGLGAVPPMGPDMGMEGGMGPSYAGGPTPASLPQPGTDYPSGEFDPSQWKDKTIEVWAHDTTIVAEKTYRYRMRYKIKNPVFGAGNVTDPAELADEFAVVSEWSDWASPITIPPLVNFFVRTSKSPLSNSVTFDVFRWEQGAQKNATFTVSPGDQVGGAKEEVDYSTGWTVVDFREDSRTSDTQIILVNDAGKLITRSFRADQGDVLYEGLKKQIAAAKATETAALPGGGPAAGR